MPALLGVGFYWFAFSFPEYVSWAYLDTFVARRAFLVEYWWHLGDLLWWIQHLNRMCPELGFAVACDVWWVLVVEPFVVEGYDLLEEGWKGFRRDSE